MEYRCERKHKNNFLLILSVLLLILVSFGYALDPGRMITQYKIIVWNDTNGLPQNMVMEIIQSANGYIWFGTEEGLIRFDGNKFVVFNKDNTPLLKDNYIFALYEDSEGTLWIAPRGGGLLTYRNGVFSNFSIENGFIDKIVNCIIEDKKKQLWIGTENNGLFLYSNNNFFNFTKKNGLSDNTVNHLLNTEANIIWISSKKGVSVYDGIKFTHYNKNTGLKDKRVNTTIISPEGDLLLGTNDGLFKKKGKSIIPIHQKGQIKAIKSLYLDKDKILWIGATNGLFRLNGEVLSKLSEKNGLSNNTVLSISADREGSLWVGTAYGGLNCLQDGKVRVIGMKEGLSDDVVFVINQDRKGFIWIGTNNGLNRFKNKKNIQISTKNGLSNNVINSIIEDINGDMWVGTDKGLNYIQDYPDRKIKIIDTQKNYYILALCNDTLNHQIWIGTLNGLFIKKGNEIKVIKDDDGKKKAILANAILSDKENSIWISSYRNGLMKYNNGKFKYYKKKDGLADNSVNCIYEDSKGIIWIGTINGLSRFSNNNFITFRKKNGLFNDNIYKIIEDDKNNLWFSCNKGIFKINRSELSTDPKNNIKIVNSIVFGKDEGMRSSECNGGFQFAGCKLDNGELLFSTMKGVVIIDPDNIKKNSMKPPIYIEKVLLDGKPVSFENIVRVHHSVKRLELRFTAISFINTKKILFKYQLQGYDDNWISAEEQRSAFYTNLDPGEYEFSVIAANSDGVWNKTGDSVKLILEAAFWETIYFKTVMVILFIILSYLIIHIIRKYITLVSFWKRKKIISSFKLLDKIGSGGMGTVYKAVNMLKKNETVAIKVLNSELFNDENSRKRFKQEAVIIDQLDHPNIIKIIERGVSNENLYMVMELLNGESLADKIKIDQYIKLNDTIHIMKQILDAIEKIHSRNIIHRDLKPENVMLIKKNDEENFVKLLDFGLATMQYQTRLTQTGVVVGTINYMAPEQITESFTTKSSDIYSLGIILYEMTTGRKPFFGETAVSLMKQIIDFDPIKPIKLRRNLPVKINNLIIRMIDKENKNRPELSEIISIIKEF